jgi:hypothetical protein
LLAGLDQVKHRGKGRTSGTRGFRGLLKIEHLAAIGIDDSHGLSAACADEGGELHCD